MAAPHTQPAVKTHRFPVRGQQEQQQDKQADASKGDKLLGTLAGVQGEPCHKQAQNHHHEHPADAKQTGDQAEELEAGISKHTLK